MLKVKEQPHQLLVSPKINKELLDPQLKDKLLPTQKIHYMLLKDLLEEDLMTKMSKKILKLSHIKLLETLMEMLGLLLMAKTSLHLKLELLFYKK